MQKVLIILLVLLSGCDLHSSKDQSVVFDAVVLDAVDRRPVAGITWNVHTTRGFGTLEVLDQGVTDASGRFRAEYEYPCCSDPFLEVNGANPRYQVAGGQVLGKGRLAPRTILLPRAD